MVRLTTKALTLLAFAAAACSKRADNNTAHAGNGNYPTEIADIIISRCATTGCHNDASALNAAGLNLSTWEKMFRGAGTGAVVIPYRPDFSTLCYYTNTDTAAGLVLQPTMPYGTAPLTREEYTRLHDWIASGAPAADGQIMFADSAGRRKFYVANRLCDVVTVVDGASQLQMRYVDAGNGTTAKYPYSVKVSPKKDNWYVSYYSRSGIISKYSGLTDKHIKDIELGDGTWQSFDITADGKHAWVADNSSSGRLAYVDLAEARVLKTFDFGGQLVYPSSVAVAHDKVFLTPTAGNFVYEVNISDRESPELKQVPVDGTGAILPAGGLSPVGMICDDSGSKLYIICAATTDVRIVDTRTGALKNVVKLQGIPAALALSKKHGLLFISCPDDIVTFPGNRGSVAVVQVENGGVVKTIKPGYQPYGLAVDDETGLVAVANANISAGGPASHHESGCGKTNGNVTFINMGTLELVAGKKLEVAVFPFAVGN